MDLVVDIEKRFGDFVLKSKFEADYEVLALLGASGCGKSVTLKCIAGIETPDKGRIILGGKVLFDSSKKINVPARKRRIGYLFQNYALFPTMSVEDNITCALKGGKQEKKEIVRKLMEQFCIEDCQGKYPGQLSGGQQQRVALARMLASAPQLIMLDEPFSALDDYLKWVLEQEIMDTLDAFKGTVLLVSHNRDEVYRIANRIAVMSQGKIESLKPKKELFENPSTLAGTLLTGCKNVTRVEYINHHQLRALDWGIILNTAQEVTTDIRYVGFRAHYFEEVPEMEAANVVDCEIARVIDNTFSMIIMFYNKGCDKGKAYARLRYEISKEQWVSRENKNNMYLKMPKHQLIFMNDGYHTNNKEE